MPDGTLEFDTRIDQSGFERGISSLNNSAATAGNIMKGFLGANLFQAAGEKLVDFAKKSVQLASDLEEVQNVVDVTFGDGATEINQFAKEASASFGLTELQAKQFSGTIGAMVKSMGLTEAEALDMSTSLVGLAGDMASFYNLDHEEAFNKIRSGISGETEPLKQLGINMSVANLEAYALTKGIKRAYDEMSEAEKVQLRYGYIMEQTNDAQGDFVRTQDSYANQVRTLQNNLDTLGANVGQFLVPALSAATGWLNNLFDGPATDETTAKINEAISALEAMDQDVQDIKNDYATQAIKIRVDYEEAQDLADEFFALKQELDLGFGDRTLKLGMSGDDVTALQNQLAALGYAVDLANEVGVFGETTEMALRYYQSDMGLAVDGIAGVNTYAALASENTEKLAAATQNLVDIYPELSQYVGEDGVLTLEQAEVEELINSYRELAIAKAMQARASGIEQEYIDAAAALKILEGEKSVVEGELTDLRSKFDSSWSVWEKAADAYGSIGMGEFDTRGALDAVNQWIEVYKDLDEVQARLDSYGTGLNIGAIVDDYGNTLDPSKIENSAVALETLMAVIKAMYEGGERAELVDDIKAAEDQLAEIDAAIAEYSPKVEKLYADWEREEAAVKAAMEDLAESGKDTGETTADKIADGMTSKSAELNAAIETLADDMQATADKNKIVFPVGVAPVNAGRNAYSHATGINYVPYDNYLARLHVGESVLTASEARAWREGAGNEIDYDRLAAAVASVSGGGATRPIVLEIDGKRLAEVQATNTRIALNSRTRTIARGYGK